MLPLSRRKAPGLLAALFVLVFATTALGQAFPAKYHTYQEVLDTLTSMRDAYPQVLYLDTLGYSTRDSIPLLRLKISDNPTIDEDEPSLFFSGGVHADEVLGVEVTMRFVEDIVTKYSQNDPDVVNFIQRLEIFVVPFQNSEGHIVVEQGDLDWRKNKSDNDTNDVFDYHDGVDNNRNFDFGWNIDTDPGATTPESLMFKGYYPFSELENQAMRDFGWQYRPLFALDLHSPSYGRPNAAYYPWYWYSSDGGHGFGPDETLMQSICLAYASSILAIPDDSGNVVYEARRALVNKGDLKTYFYGNFGTAAFSVEISDTTIQDTALVDSITAAHLPGLYYLLGRALGPGITGIIRDSVTLEPLEAEVQVLQHINADINPRLSRPDFGRYRRLLAPGSYTLRFLKNGYATKNIGVTVGSGAPTNTDVLLRPLYPVPPAPVLVSPPDDSIIDTVFVEFSWNPAATATGYVIEIAVDAAFQSVVAYDSSLAMTSYQNPSPLGEGMYYWRVTAFNSNGYSDRSVAWSFEILFSPLPQAPTLLYPVNTTVDTSIVIFDWSDVPVIDGYVFELASDSQFTAIVEFDSTVATSGFTNTIPLGDGGYWWRVTAYNVNGHSPRSAAAFFNVELGLPAPVLVSPAEGFVSTSAYVTFDWLDVSSAARYLIQISDDPQFGTLVIFDSTLTVSGYTNTDSLPDGTFYWRVKAQIPPVWGPYCSPWEFCVDVDTSGVVFVPGDVNNDGLVLGSDITYLVNYLRGGAPPPIEVNGFYPGADANGDCRNLGSDVTYLVNYLRGGSLPIDGDCF